MDDTSQKEIKNIFKFSNKFNFSKYLFIPLLAIALVIVIISFLKPTSNVVSAETFDVTHVSDGDTINVKDSSGQTFTVRYLYIDTPESVKIGTPVQCYAKEAGEYNKKLLEGKKVKLEQDVEDKDIYGRLLRYVYIDQNNDGKFEEMVNDILLKNGYARIYTPPKGIQQKNVRYESKFVEDEKYAKENSLGLWNECTDDSGNYVPYIPSASVTPGTQGESEDRSKGLKEETIDCKIKGNISASGSKIYHMPGQKYYSQTQVEVSKGERWFCTEQDAQNNGYRKSKV